MNPEPLKTILGQYPGPILYVGSADDPVHAELQQTERAVEAVDPSDASGPAAAPDAPPYGVVVVPGPAFAAWCRNGGRARFQSLISDRLAPDGVVVTDPPESGEVEDALLAAGLVESYRAPAAAEPGSTRLHAFRRKNPAPLCHPFQPFALSGSPGRVLVLEEGKGCRIRDQDGKEYLDATAGLWSLHVGLGNEEIIEAITDQLRRFTYGTLFAERGHQPAIDLAERLIELAPYPMQWVSFTGSGSESTEVAMRVASYYQVLAGRKTQKRVAHLDESFHGSFAASSCVSALNPFRPLAANAVPSVALPTPNPDKCPKGVDYETFALQCADALETEAKAGDVSCFIVEPVLGSAGALAPPKVYFDRIREICDRYDIVLILDEVATGFGRTGRWFACEHYDLRPDIMTLAKGINSGYAPLGAVLYSAAIGEQFRVRNQALPHGSTYNGHPMCCASALANLRIIERDGLVERAAEMGEALFSELEKLEELDCVRQVRGLGLMASVVLRQADGSPPGPLQIYRIYKRIQAAGVLVYPAPLGFTLTPPLIVTREEIETMTSRIRDVLASVHLSDGQVTEPAVA